MSGNSKAGKSSVNSLHADNPRYQWLYKRPPLPKRTQHYFDAEQYITKQKKPVNLKPASQSASWTTRLVARDPKKFLFTGLLAGCAVMLSPIFFIAVANPSITLAGHVYDAIFPSTLVVIEDDEE